MWLNGWCAFFGVLMAAGWAYPGDDVKQIKVFAVVVLFMQCLQFVKYCADDKPKQDCNRNGCSRKQ